MSDLPDFARALGVIPSGLFIVSAGRLGAGGAQEATAMLGTFVQQVGFEPPVLMVGVKKGRPIGELMRDGFCVSILHDGSRHHMKHFARGFEPGAPAFEGCAVETTSAGVPFLTDVVAHVECRFVGTADWTDHLAVAGEIVGGVRRTDEPPMFHSRKNGLSY